MDFKFVIIMLPNQTNNKGEVLVSIVTSKLLKSNKKVKIDSERGHLSSDRGLILKRECVNKTV